MELRLYNRKGKFFAPFDPQKFIEAFQKETSGDERRLANPMIDAAIRAATGGVDEDGRPIGSSKMEVGSYEL